MNCITDEGLTPEKNDVLAKSYSNTANTYEIMKNYQKAIEFQEKALKVYKNHNQNENLIFINECNDQWRLSCVQKVSNLCMHLSPMFS